MQTLFSHGPMLRKYYIVLYAGYFFLLLAIGMYVRDIPNQPSILATISNFMTEPPNVIKLGDPQSFALGAKEIYTHGWITPENHWLINLWPPGFMALEGLVLALFGMDTHFILILLVLSAALSAYMLVLLRICLDARLNARLAELLPLLLFCVPMVRLFLLEPIGLVLGEAFAIILFLISILLMILARRRESVVTALSAGAALGLSAYIRSQFEIIIMFMTISAVLGCAVWKVIGRRDDAAGRKFKLFSDCNVKVIVATMLMAQVTMLPWRIYKLDQAGALGWVQTSALTYRNGGLTAEEMIASGGRFVVQGGGTIACKLEPSYCGKSDAKLFYTVFFSNMIEWYRYKLTILDDYWMASLRDIASISHNPTATERFINYVLFLCFAFSGPLLWYGRKRREFPLLLWVSVSVYSSFFAIFTFVHFEVRYFYLIKIFSVFLILLSSPPLFFKVSAGLERILVRATTRKTDCL